MNGSNLSAFGDIVTVQPTPVFQADFVYGLNDQVWSTAVVSGTGANAGVTITAGQSVASSDVAGTTVTGGTRIYSIYAAHGALTGTADFQDYDVFVAPAETLTISAESTLQTTVAVSVNWTEDI